MALMAIPTNILTYQMLLHIEMDFISRGGHHIHILHVNSQWLLLLPSGIEQIWTMLMGAISG